MLMMDASSLLCSCGRNPCGYGAEGGCSTIAFNCAGISNGVLHRFFTSGGEPNPPIPYQGDASIHPSPPLLPPPLRGNSDRSCLYSSSWSIANLLALTIRGRFVLGCT